MTTTRNCLLAAVLGVALFAAGLATARTFPEALGWWVVVPRLGVAIGGGVVGASLAMLAMQQVMRRRPALAQQAQIERGDERSIAIRDRAKAQAFTLMQVLYAAVLVVLAVLRVDLAAVVALSAAYIVVTVSQAYFLHRLSKTM